MKVAQILSLYEVAITRDGSIFVGDIVAVGNRLITDPETGVTLGTLPRTRMKVTEVYDKFFVAELYRLVPPRERSVTITVGDDVVMA